MLEFSGLLLLLFNLDLSFRIRKLIIAIHNTALCWPWQAH